jgi:hypothetical protein
MIRHHEVNGFFSYSACSARLGKISAPGGAYALSVDTPPAKGRPRDPTHAPSRRGLLYWKVYTVNIKITMAQRLKRWESPRKGGRNAKGKGGSARQRQKAKQLKVLRAKLKQNGDASPGSPSIHHTHSRTGEVHSSPVLFYVTWSSIQRFSLCKFKEQNGRPRRPFCSLNLYQ